MAATVEKALPLLPPPEGLPDVLILAGEHSGDEHAARAVAELRARHPDWNICAVGGRHLQAAGAQLLFDLTAHSVLGLIEVLRHYRFFKGLMEATVAWIREHRPRLICLVDYPGFNLRLAKRLQKEGLTNPQGDSAMRVFFYIGPQIWAWKGHRRFAMAEVLDAVGVIFPFETECYHDVPQLPVRFVGHPFVQEGFQLPLAFSPRGPVLLLPGSRQQAVRRIFPAMLAAWKHFRQGQPEAEAAVVYPDATVRTELSRVISEEEARRIGLRFVDNASLMQGQPLAARAVLTSSGTMSLLCALAGIPGAIVYRAHPLTYLIGRSVLKVPYLGIANLLQPDNPIYPEFIQGAAQAKVLSARLATLWDSEKEQARTQEAAAKLRKGLSSPPDLTPARMLEACMKGELNGNAMDG